MIVRKRERMTDKETGQTRELADIIVEKFRALLDLESTVLDTREEVSRISAAHNTTEPSDLQEKSIVEHQEMLTTLESQLEEGIEEMEKIMDELKLTTPSFRTYILPQMSEIVTTLRAYNAAEQEELAQLVAALTDEENTQSLEQLEAIIITRLRDNLEKTFGT